VPETRNQLIDSSVAVDCGEDTLLRRIDGESEVGVGVCPVEQNGHGAGRHSVPDAKCPWQTQRNVVPPGITAECDRLALADAIGIINGEIDTARSTSALGIGPTFESHEPARIVVATPVAIRIALGIAIRLRRGRNSTTPIKGRV